MKIQQFNFKFFLTLLFVVSSVISGCSHPDTKESKKENVTADSSRSVNAQLIRYIDEVAAKLSTGVLPDSDLVVLTAQFSKYFPIVIYKDGDSVPEHTVMVTRNRSVTADEPERISLSLPQAIGERLTLKELTEHFGPLLPEGILGREHETPFPFIISLKKHLKLPDEKMSIHIAASDYPESKNNQIKSIEIININPQ